MDDCTLERTLALPGGRTLASATMTAGDVSSKTVLLYLHAAFRTGDTSEVSRITVSKNIRYVCPTLPDWGNTSPPPSSTPYVDCLTSDMTALLDHLYPEHGRDIKLYVSGVSFGTVPAQMLYGVPYDRFPYGRCIVSVLLVAALTPFRYHKDYAKHMTWANYLLTSPITQWFPFRYLLTFNMALKLSNVDNAEKFLRRHLFDKMDEAKRELFAQWRAKEGVAEGETERRFATDIVRSVAKTWEGFRLIAPVQHSDWGFRPYVLDEEHS